MEHLSSSPENCWQNSKPAPKPGHPHGGPWSATRCCRERCSTSLASLLLRSNDIPVFIPGLHCSAAVLSSLPTEWQMHRPGGHSKQALRGSTGTCALYLLRCRKRTKPPKKCSGQPVPRCSTCQVNCSKQPWAADPREDVLEDTR